MTEKRFKIDLDEEAIKKFMEQHNFPFPNTKDYWDCFKGYAEEFKVVEE